MAPPPPSNAPLQQRLVALAQTLQFAWFAGHVTLLLATLQYTFSYITFKTSSGFARFSYRLCFVAAAATYGIVVYKGYRSRVKSGKLGSPLSLIADENVQYLFMALVWLFSRQIPLAILPFAVYSIFHVATYTRGSLIPVIQGNQGAAAGASPGAAKPAPTGLSAQIGNFVKQYYDASMTLVAILEIGLWFRILGSALLFQKGSWILIGIYTVFFRARYAQSSFVQGAIRQVTARVDAQVANQSTPPAVRQGWETFKGLVAQAAQATDVNRYVQGQQAAPKKAQ